MEVCGGGVEECPGWLWYGELHSQIAFLAHPNQRYRPAHPGCQTFHDPAALIDDPGQVDAALL